jgi:hypothetical protein
VEAGDYVRLLRRRWPLLVILALSTGLVAWISVSSSPPAFSQTLHFVLHPDASFDRADVPNAIDVLGEDSPLTQTVIGALPSQRVFGRAVAGVTTVAEALQYELDVSRAPGSTLIDATIRGPDRNKVTLVAKALAPEASAYVAGTYPGYVLTLLGTESVPGPGGSGELTLVGMAVVFGTLLGASAIFAEGLLRGRKRSRTRRTASSRGEKAPAKKQKKPVERRPRKPRAQPRKPEPERHDGDRSKKATPNREKPALKVNQGPPHVRPEPDTGDNESEPPVEVSLDSGDPAQHRRE